MTDKERDQSILDMTIDILDRRREYYRNLIDIMKRGTTPAEHSLKEFGVALDNVNKATVTIKAEYSRV